MLLLQAEPHLIRVMAAIVRGSTFCPSVPRPILFIIAVCLLVAFFTARHVHVGDAKWLASSIPSIAFASGTLLSAHRPLKLFFTELQAAHDEVLAPLLQAFGSLPGAEVDRICMYKLNRFGAFDMFEALHVPIALPQPVGKEEQFPYIFENSPDFIVATSCGYDSFEEYERLLNETNTHIFCVVHHSDKWSDWMFGYYERRLSAWVAADRIDFVTLSQHVTNSLADALLNWKVVKHDNHYPPIRTFPPVFTVHTAPAAEEKADNIHFALQGNYQAERRNFTQVFQELSLAKDQIAQGKDGVSKSTELTLHLVGSGSPKPEVPDNIKDMVVFDENLNYTDFYNVLSGMTAILPAFADDDYFVHKASSSVPASIISGSPIVATRRMLDMYSYLDEDAVWLQGQDETDFEAVWDIVKKPRSQRERKRADAKHFAKQIVKQNQQNVASWAEHALELRQERSSTPEH